MNKPSGDKWEDIGHAAGGELADAAITGPAALAGGGAAVGGVKEVAEHATAHVAKKAAKKAFREGAEETIEHTAEAGLRHTAKHEAGELSEKARQLLLDWLKAKEAWYAEWRKTRA